MKALLFLCVLALIPNICFGQVTAGCQCSDFACGCCVDQIPLINDVCVNITWTQGLNYIHAEMVVNNIVVWQEQVSENGPTDACASVIGIEVCLDIANLDISSVGACGTVYVNVSGLGLSFEWDLGNFQIGQCASAISDYQKIPALDDLNRKKKPIGVQLFV